MGDGGEHVLAWETASISKEGAQRYLPIKPTTERRGAFLDTFSVESTVGMRRADAVARRARVFATVDRTVPGVDGTGAYPLPERPHRSKISAMGPFSPTQLQATTNPERTPSLHGPALSRPNVPTLRQRTRSLAGGSTTTRSAIASPHFGHTKPSTPNPCQNSALEDRHRNYLRARFESRFPDGGRGRPEH